MAVKNFFIFLSLVFILLLASVSCTSDKVPLRAQDRVEIQHLMREYIQALDSHNAEALIAQFTPDGQLKAGKDAAKGQDAIKKMVVDAWKNMEAANKDDKNQPRMYHIVTNPYIEFIDKDHARYHAYWMGLLKTGEIVAAGREVNELVRINGQWLISLRDVEPED